MNYIEDNVKFIMPEAREYQFAALAVVQAFVAGYDNKMKINHVLPTEDTKFRLHYELAMSIEDYDFFVSAGLELQQEPEIFEPGEIDMELDFTIDRALQFYTYDRHLCQIYGALCGVQTNPTPIIRRVKAALTRNVYEIDNLEAAELALLNAQDEEISCVVGKQSWVTYLAVSMGLPTIEIIDGRANRAWLSKWCSPVYRVLESTSMDLREQAILDLEEVVAALRARDADKQAAETVQA